MKFIFAILLVIVAVVSICIRWSYMRDKGYGREMMWLHFFHDVPIRVIDRLDETYSNRYYAPSSGKSAKKQGVDIDSYPAWYGANYAPEIAAVMLQRQQASAINDQLLASGGWKCACGKVNAVYISSCSCGRNKDGALPPQPQPAVQEIYNETKNAAAIREYKRLMDDGIITPEEFEVKKKQLLGI